jgi:hypothetical protein
MPWNRGTTYRNEGVDIGFDPAKKSHFINHIEAGEWTEYTLEADQAGVYGLSVEVKATVATGRLGVSVNNELLAVDTAVVQSEKWQQVKLANVKLLQGTNKIRIYANAGGYNLVSLQLKN